MNKWGEKIAFSYSKLTINYHRRKENHHLAIIKAIINLAKKHQWILKLGGENLMRVVYL